jgi:hypothetical protein
LSSYSPVRAGRRGNGSCRRDQSPADTVWMRWSCRADCRADRVHQRPPRQTRPTAQPPPRSRPRTEVRAFCPSSCGPSEHRVRVDPLCTSTASPAGLGRVCDQGHISVGRGSRSARPRTSDVRRPSFRCHDGRRCWDQWPLPSGASRPLVEGTGTPAGWIVRRALPRPNNSPSHGRSVSASALIGRPRARQNRVLVVLRVGDRNHPYARPGGGGVGSSSGGIRLNRPPPPRHMGRGPFRDVVSPRNAARTTTNQRWLERCRLGHHLSPTERLGRNLTDRTHQSGSGRVVQVRGSSLSVEDRPTTPGYRPRAW